MTDLLDRRNSVTERDYLPSADPVLMPVPHGIRCSMCGKFKDAELFPRQHKTRSGRAAFCRACKSEHIDKPYNKRTTEQRSLKIRTRRYDITVEQYRDLLDKQNGVCAICKQPESKVTKGSVCTLAVDHDHVTGEVRGLLCDRCNRGLGYFADNADMLTLALQYLIRTP